MRLSSGQFHSVYAKTEMSQIKWDEMDWNGGTALKVKRTKKVGDDKKKKKKRRGQKAD